MICSCTSTDSVPATAQHLREGILRSISSPVNISDNLKRRLEEEPEKGGVAKRQRQQDSELEEGEVPPAQRIPLGELEEGEVPPAQRIPLGELEEGEVPPDERVPFCELEEGEVPPDERVPFCELEEGEVPPDERVPFCELEAGEVPLTDDALLMERVGRFARLFTDAEKASKRHTGKIFQVDNFISIDEYGSVLSVWG